jgi:hypothetical protein
MMNVDQGGKTQGDKERVPWVFLIDRLGPDTYALRGEREISLVDGVALTRFLRQIIGGWHGQVGGDDVGRT